MTVCPNVNTAEWKALVAAVGTFEAYRDFIQTDGQIRSPEEVKAKLENPSPNLLETDYALNPNSPEVRSEEDLNTTMGNALVNNPQFEMDTFTTSNTAAFEMATKMSEQLGIEFEIVTGAEAAQLTQDAKNPWTGEPAFFIGGKVFFIGTALNMDNVFHEFSHPFVRTIAKTNNQLFNNLFNKVMSTAEGMEVINQVTEAYPELDTGSDLFKEEVLVRVLTEAALNENNQTEVPTGLRKVIKDIMYAIKQLMRKIFGQKVGVQELSPTTSMKDLADMLVKGQKFELETELVNEDDVAAYARDQQEEIENLNDLPNKEVQALINRAYDTASTHIRELQRNQNFDELALLLLDEYNEGDLQLLKKDIQNFQTLVNNRAENTVKDYEYRQQQASAFVNMLYRLEQVMIKIDAHAKDIRKHVDSQDALGKAYYYNHLIKSWQGFIEEVEEAINSTDNDLSHDSAIGQVTGKISNLMKRASSTINAMNMDGARDMLYNELEPMGRNIKTRYEEIIKNLEEKGAPQRSIDRMYKEYHGLNQADYAEYKALEKRKEAGEYLDPSEASRLERMKTEAMKNGLEITPDKIEYILKGQIKDANFFNSYLEGYMYSADPIIGGLALHVKNKMTEVMARAQAKHNEFTQDMEEALKKINYNPHKPGELGQKVGFLDKVGTEEKGEFQEREVWTLINRFKNYRHDKHRLEFNKKQAHARYSQTNSDEDRIALNKATAELKEFNRKFMNQRYVDEFYELEDIFERDEIGQEAARRRESNFEARKILMSRVTTEAERLEVQEQIEALDRERRQMYSLMNPDGTPKEGEELAITQRLLEHRDASFKFYEWVEKPNAFSNAYQSFLQEMADQNVTGEALEDAKKAWLRRNAKIEYTDAYYDDIDRIIRQIKEITSRLPGAEQREFDRTQLFERLRDITFTIRDTQGIPNATNLSENLLQEVKEIQEQLLEISAESREIPGLEETNSRITELVKLKSREGGLTEDQSAELQALFKKKNELMDAYTVGDDKALLRSLYGRLAELTLKEPTNYYVDTLNHYLSEIEDLSAVKEQIGQNYVDRSTADLLTNNQAAIERLMEQSDAFREWFLANHVERERYDVEAEGMVSSWMRIPVWSVSRPDAEAVSDDGKSYYKTTEIKDETGNVIETVVGVPSSRFMTRNVKQEYHTKEIVGVTVDNRGRWLPKNMDQNPADDRYINEKYEEMRQSDPNLFNVLEKLTQHHLKNQEGLGNRAKLYLDFPRFMREGLEAVQSKDARTKKWNALTHYAKRAREFFTGAKDDAESGFNKDDEFDLVRTDIFDNEITGVPIYGLYDLDASDVSTDITHSMMRYMLQAERHKQLVEISPFARAVQSVVNDPRNGLKDMAKKDKFNLIHRAVNSYKDKKGESIRQKAVNAFMEREFEGQQKAGFTKDVRWLNNLANVLFKRASFSFFALNIPSALKNSFGAKFQGMIEASAGQHMNMGDFALGEAWALKAMTEVSAQIYRKGPKSLHVQMIELFDPSQGRFEDKFGESLSRTVTKDAASLTWLYNFRRWVELQATMQTYAGMMNHTKVEQLQPDGKTVKKIPYLNAWEVKDGKIQLKAGIDPEWGVTYDEQGKMHVGKKFTQERNKIHQVMNNLQGAYARFDQPEAQRYIGFRFLSYLRRYFTTMAVNRWGKTRINPGLNDVHQGFYITFMQTMRDTALSLGRNLPYMRKEEKRAAIKVLTEVLSLSALLMAMPLLFGWDPDDEDKYEKLRDKSGAIPFPFAPSDPDRPFDAWGYLENHALFLMMNIRAENEQFLPFPGFGMDDYDAMLDLKSIAFGPTTHTYNQLFMDSRDIVMQNESAYYKRDVGPYRWQKQGGTKFWAHLGVALGLTGSSVDPVKGIKGFQSVQARGR